MRRWSAFDRALGLTDDALTNISLELDALNASVAERDAPALVIPGGRFDPPTTRGATPTPYPSFLLQEAHIRLTQLLSAHRLLPITSKGPDWDAVRTKGQMEVAGIGRGGMASLNRLGIQNFFAARGREATPPNGTCLFWDETQLARHTRCGRLWTLHYRGGATVHMDARRSALHADLIAIGEAGAGNASGMFDVIVCPQVFEHILRPFEAARGLAALLKPGGRLLFTVPFAERYHEVPTDGFRYTLDGAASLLSSAGLVVDERYRIGDTLLALGFLLGWGPQDIPPARLRASLLIRDEGRELSRSQRASALHTAPGEWLWMSSALIATKPLVVGSSHGY